MLLNKIKGKTQKIKGHLKEAWGRIAGNKETLAKGRQDKFFGRIREKHGITKEQVKERLHKFEEESNSAEFHMF